jgi:hypothetical protein
MHAIRTLYDISGWAERASAHDVFLACQGSRAAGRELHQRVVEVPSALPPEAGRPELLMPVAYRPSATFSKETKMALAGTAAVDDASSARSPRIGRTGGLRPRRHLIVFKILSPPPHHDAHQR